MGIEAEIQPSHIGLCVTDIDRSKRFYCDGLGFAVGAGYDLDGTMMPGLDRSLEVTSPVAVRSQFVELGAMRIELLQFAAPIAAGSPSATRAQFGFTHLSFTVPDVDVVAARLEQLGGTILPTTRANLGIEVVFLADPDGARIELMAMPH